MDPNKVGRLILNLRKEKGMTQKELAEQLFVSAKTISKWECAQGCPDVSLLHQLSQVFKVDIERILMGEMRPNDPDGGNMKRIRFYMCQACGNIMTSTGEGELSCCGRKLQAMEAKKADEDHKLNVEEIEYDYFVTFDHEMTKEHYMSFMAYVADNSVLLMKLYPEQSGELRFPRMHGGKLYYGCNRHGLWIHD